jgi:Heterokaryon incompatibility protein (HET)
MSVLHMFVCEIDYQGVEYLHADEPKCLWFLSPKSSEIGIELTAVWARGYAALGVDSSAPRTLKMNQQDPCTDSQSDCPACFGGAYPRSRLKRRQQRTATVGDNLSLILLRSTVSCCQVPLNLFIVQREQLRNTLPVDLAANCSSALALGDFSRTCPPA